MVNNRRSEFEIISKLCDISKFGAKKTELLYQGNLSYTQLTSYLDLLLENDIIEILPDKHNDKKSKFYQLTKKGNEFLSDINKTLAYLK